MWTLQAIKLPAFKGSHAEAVAETRVGLDDVKRRMIETRKLASPQAQAEARVKEGLARNALKLDVAPTTWLRQQANEFALSTRERPAEQGHIIFPTRREIFDGGRTGELDEAFRFLAWLFPDEIFAKAKAELAALYKASGPGISVEERKRVIAALEAEYLALERREEFLIRVAEDSGETICRRPYATVEAALGVMPKV